MELRFKEYRHDEISNEDSLNTRRRNREKGRNEHEHSIQNEVGFAATEPEFEGESIETMMHQDQTCRIRSLFITSSGHPDLKAASRRMLLRNRLFCHGENSFDHDDGSSYGEVDA